MEFPGIQELPLILGVAPGILESVQEARTRPLVAVASLPDHAADGPEYLDLELADVVTLERRRLHAPPRQFGLTLDAQEHITPQCAAPPAIPPVPRFSASHSGIVHAF